MTWIRAAATVASYRRIYDLAAEIAAHEGADKTVRRAARRILRCLEKVIDMPIAESARLAKAMQRFGELRQELARVGGPLEAVDALDYLEVKEARDKAVQPSLQAGMASTPEEAGSRRQRLRRRSPKQSKSHAEGFGKSSRQRAAIDTAVH